MTNELLTNEHPFVKLIEGLPRRAANNCVHPADGHAYALEVQHHLEAFLRPDESLRVYVDYFNHVHASGLQVLILRFTPPLERERVGLAKETLGQILHRLTEEKPDGGDMSSRVLTYYDDETVYLIKPGQRAYWTAEQARKDAFGIIGEILTEPVNPFTD